jgi:5-methyltetrahydropteroyltriglutamate--homocysteine methyltransferase
VQISSERILTTHTGSLPRPDDLLELLVARDRSEPYDQAAFDERLQAAVDYSVQKQIAAGIDIVNDGEMSKIGYGAYVKERLTGYGGEEAPSMHASDLDEISAKDRGHQSPQTFQRLKADCGMKFRNIFISAI